MDQQVYIFAALLIGLVAGAVAIWWLQRERLASAVAQAKAESQIELARLGERLSAAQEDVRRLTAAHAEAESGLQQLELDVGNLRQKLGAAESTVAGQLEQLSRLQREKDELAALRDQLTAERQRLSAQIAELNTLLEAERSQSVEKLQLLQNAEAQLTDRFKTLAGEILEDKTKRFTEQNQTNLNQLLEPLKVKITEFQGKVEEVYVQEGKDRSALAEQVKQLMSLNNQLSKDAHNLTSALKGQAKAQGNWGELILERVLEASGLRKGFEYDVQESHTRADGTRAQPDVVVHLPEDRHLIVDAKVSLTAYEEHANAETDHQREAALKRHLDSVRAHIKELSEKNYQQLYGLKSLDFVLMFIPVEPAFMLAISHDSELWQDAWKKNVLLVSPSTLLFVVRTVAHLWRQEQQNRNAQDIASRGAELYDKLVGFVGDLENLGDKLDQAKRSYDGALNKFANGRGNVIRQAEMLKELGVKPTKQLPPKLVELSQDEPLADNAKLLDEPGR
ncbi:MAG: DNA recombination protein RmuC [Gallionella sp.]|jgi:DNA recombination protein RmuC|nr:DNA recombination protein RmuC [Gallionella sp.]MCK9355165.1 DNA recombination protein RmuC [Gallionella sp.]